MCHPPEIPQPLRETAACRRGVPLLTVHVARIAFYKKGDRMYNMMRIHGRNITLTW